MKKWIALALAFVMVLSMNVMAFADETSKDITVTVVQYDVTSVKIDWESLDFVYTYTDANTGSWNKESASVTVTNNSNHAIYFDASLNANNSRFEDIYASMEEIENVELGIGENRTFAIAINGDPSNYNVGKTTIGNVSITIRNA